MRSFLLAALVCAPLLSQTPATDLFHRAPPHIEEALRQRVAKFYQAHVDSKFRLADTVVAEESKDAFFEMQKKTILSFEILRINYSDNFTKATVVTATEVEWSTPRLGKMIVKPPVTSLWKLENGEWFWYVAPESKTQWDSPWGKMHPGPDNGSPVMEALRRADPKAILSQIKVSKGEILLSSYQPASDSAEIGNNMPGEILLDLESPEISGLDMKLDKTKLKQGESARLVASYHPVHKGPKPTVEAFVRVQPTGQVLSFSLKFAIPPEVERQLPKSR